jgi:hypothetical protein
MSFAVINNWICQHALKSVWKEDTLAIHPKKKKSKKAYWQPY